jgi:hypothetical protein
MGLTCSLGREEAFLDGAQAGKKFPHLNGQMHALGHTMKEPSCSWLHLNTQVNIIPAPIWPPYWKVALPLGILDLFLMCTLRKKDIGDSVG